MLPFNHVLRSTGRVLLGYRSPLSDYLTIGLGGYEAAYTITHFNLSTGWRGIASAGRQENLNSWAEVQTSGPGSRPENCSRCRWH